jgi:hypothetical protein
MIRALLPPLVALVVLAHAGAAFPLARRASAHDGPHETPAPARPAGAVMVLPDLPDAVPWTDKPVIDDPDRFQIAIMTDHTGGHRPGIWMDAVAKLNMLRPAFVMSVGDLVEGFTDDREEALRQWREFQGFVDRLDMRFFFVAGNHDLSNDLLDGLWREKFGPTWYSFDYKRVHFLCLCSEDPVLRIGDDQLAFVRADLAAHADARHTLVFLHRPLWTTAERDLAEGRDDSTNWKRVEALLADRPHTVFSGHIHHYVQYSRNGGRQYYALATTGGGSQLRGQPYGEFDHVTWLTMEHDGPQVVNLTLDGILPPDVVTEEESVRFRDFLARTVVEVAPIFLEDAAGFAEGDLHVRLTNGIGTPVALEGEFDGLPLCGLTVDPERLTLQASAGGEATASVRLRFGEAIAFSRLAGATFRARLRTPGPDGLFAERLVPVVIDQRHACPRVAARPDLGGPDWLRGAYGTDGAALVLGDAASWTGPNDGGFSFVTGHDAQRFVIDAHVTDERIEAGDAVEFFLDTRPDDKRRADPRMLRGTLRVKAAAPDTAGRSTVEAFVNRRPLDGCSASGRRVPGGYDLRIELPLRPFGRNAASPVPDFLLAGALHDVDEPRGPEATILWRGSPAIRERNTGYATFFWGE